MALNSARRKALWVVPVPEYGGVARHVVDVARAGLPGYELVVLAPQGALTTELKKLGTQVISDSNFGVESGFAKSFKTLDRVLDEVKPDILHAHLAYADIVATAVVLNRKIRRLRKAQNNVPKLATTEHGIADSGTVYNSNILRAFAMKVLHFGRLLVTDIKIAVSDSTAYQMKKQWGASKVHTIYNGIDIESVAQAVQAHRIENTTGAPRLLSLSRLSPEKGLDVLLDAFAEVKKKYPNATLELAGKGDLTESLKKQANALGLDESVSFPGFVNPAEAMGRNDIVVQLSVWENLSYTLLDAKAAGLKVLATDVGGNSEILFDLELVPPLTLLPKNKKLDKVATAIVQIWDNSVIPGAAVTTSEHMCQAITTEYQKGGK